MIGLEACAYSLSCSVSIWTISSPSSEHSGHIYIPWGKISLSVFWQLLKHVLSPVHPPKRNFSSSFFKMMVFFFLLVNTEISLRLTSLKVFSVHIMFLNTRSFHQIQDMTSQHAHLMNLNYCIWMNLRELSCLLLKMIRVLNTRRSWKACWVTSWVPWDRSQGGTNDLLDTALQ